MPAGVMPMNAASSAAVSTWWHPRIGGVARARRAHDRDRIELAGLANAALTRGGELGGRRRTLTRDATGAAILGHPLRAVQLLTEHLERRQEFLPAGSLVLAGALTDAVPLLAGRSYRLTVDELGTITTAPAR